MVSHLLSVSLNQRVRLRVFCADDELPVVDSVTDLWASANWFEREAFDLYGIVFEGHVDLRRILTDYGFIGHPFRKDFPISGHVEMRYDPERQRVIYQPVTHRAARDHAAHHPRRELRRLRRMTGERFVERGTFQANTAEPASPGRWCCPLEGEAAAGRFGGESIHG